MYTNSSFITRRSCRRFLSLLWMKPIAAEVHDKEKMFHHERDLAKMFHQWIFLSLPSQKRRYLTMKQNTQSLSFLSIVVNRLHLIKPFKASKSSALALTVAHSTPPWLRKDTFNVYRKLDSIPYRHTGSLYLPPARDFLSMSSSDESQEDMMNDR